MAGVGDASDTLVSAAFVVLEEGIGSESEENAAAVLPRFISFLVFLGEFFEKPAGTRKNTSNESPRPCMMNRMMN